MRILQKSTFWKNPTQTHPWAVNTHETNEITRISSPKGYPRGTPGGTPGGIPGRGIPVGTPGDTPGVPQVTSGCGPQSTLGYRGQHFWSKSAYFVYFAYFYIFLTCFSIYFDYFFDIKLIVNKRGAPEAPPIHYPINFTSKKLKTNTKKHLKIYNNMWTYVKIYKNPSLSATWSLSFYLRNSFLQQYPWGKTPKHPEELSQVIPFLAGVCETLYEMSCHV